MISGQSLSFAIITVNLTVVEADKLYLDFGIFADLDLILYLGFLRDFDYCTLLNSNFDYQSFVHFITDFNLCSSAKVIIDFVHLLSSINP